VVLIRRRQRGFAARGAESSVVLSVDGFRAVTRIGLVCAALYAAGAAHAAPRRPHVIETGAGRPALIDTACIRAKPALHHVALDRSTRFCCSPGGGCATPLASTVIELPAVSGHT
jgi:hypothetical protein